MGHVREIMSDLQLGFGINFLELYQRDGLIKLDKLFVEELAKSNTALHNSFVEARANYNDMEDKDLSNLLIDAAPYLEDFIATLFGIHSEVLALQTQHNELAPIYACKRLFVQRRASKYCKPAEIQNLDIETLTSSIE